MKKTAKEFWEFASMEHVEYMFEHYGLIHTRRINHEENCKRVLGVRKYGTC
nr:MAG TPA: casein kinase II [Caudoviricetes sp.]